jgi:hypothetical protein
MFFNHKDIKEHIKRLKTGNLHNLICPYIPYMVLKKKAARTEQLFFYIISFVGQASRFP